MNIIVKIRNIILFLHRINILCTLRANMKLLPWSEGKRLPILIFGKTTLKIGNSAHVDIKCPTSFGLLWIGAQNYNDIRKGARNHISLQGNIELHGGVRFNYNTVLIIAAKGTLSLLGTNDINHDSSVLVRDKVTLCQGSSIGWNVQICDDAFHYVDNNGVVGRKTRPIIIGREAWVGSFCKIGRGAYLPDYSILSMCSLLNKDFSSVGTNLLIGGIPAKVIKTGTKRIMESVNTELCDSIDRYFEEHPEDNTLLISEIINTENYSAIRK